MSRADAVLAQVSQRMQDDEAIFEALDHAEWKARNDADRSPLLTDIASAIASVNYAESPAHRETIAIRLLNSLESYARSALTDAAESDIPLEDDEDDDDQ